MVGEGFWLAQNAAVQGGVALQAAVRVMVCVGKGVCGVLRGRGGLFKGRALWWLVVAGSCARVCGCADSCDGQGSLLKVLADIKNK